MPAAKFQIIRKCPICGSEFLAKTIESLYCSPKCSKTAWKRKHDEKLRLEKMDEAVKDIPESKEMITVPEAYLLFGISKETIYRQIQKGNITGVNAGKRMTLVSKTDLMKNILFVLRLLMSLRHQQRFIEWNRRIAIPLVTSVRSINWMKVRSINISVNTPYLLDK